MLEQRTINGFAFDEFIFQLFSQHNRLAMLVGIKKESQKPITSIMPTPDKEVKKTGRL
ncbi:MAG: hypothetical protein K0U86_12335 [Planctomycetes bacterium]|nr:hypothetical protein [Planctomycetota bacterium]